MESRREAPSELAGRIERMLQVNRASPFPRGDRQPWALAAALAAALVLGLLPSAYFWSENRALHGAMLAQSAAMERLARAITEPRRSAQHASPPAEVMYAPDGSWYFVVVRDASQTACGRVDARRRAHDARQRDPAR